MPATSTPPSTATIDRKPLYAVAGAADAAVVALRELPARLTGAVGDEKLRAEIRNRFSELPAEVKALRDGFPDLVVQAQGRATELPLRLRERMTEASKETARAYDGFATRGEGVVGRIQAEYGPVLEGVVATLRGRVADAADDVAEITQKAADELGTKR